MTLQRERVVNEVNEMSGISGWLMRRLITKKRLDKQYESMMTRVNAEDKPDFISMYCGLVKQPAKWIREHFEYDDHSLEKYTTCHCLAKFVMNFVSNQLPRDYYPMPNQLRHIVLLI